VGFGTIDNVDSFRNGNVGPCRGSACEELIDEAQRRKAINAVGAWEVGDEIAVNGRWENYCRSAKVTKHVSSPVSIPR
jgi:hypothetical protein